MNNIGAYNSLNWGRLAEILADAIIDMEATEPARAAAWLRLLRANKGALVERVPDGLLRVSMAGQVFMELPVVGLADGFTGPDVFN